MEVEDRITRAKIQIQKNQPFFAYFSLYLKFIEDKKGILPDFSLGAGVSAKGDFYYRKEAVEKWTDKELTGVIAHEIMHLVLLHLLRRFSRDFNTWNVACDIVVNYLLKQNGFQLPKGAIETDRNNNVNLFGQINIKDVDKKTAEEIYLEIENPKEEDSDGNGQGNGQGKGKTKQNPVNEQNKNDGRFDFHIEDTESMTEEEKKELQDYWLNKVAEAYVSAKLKGNLPLGVERLIGKLHEQQINWRALLSNYIIQSIPQDYDFTKPNKKSYVTGSYIAGYVKEKIDIIVGIDLSGSIGEQEITDFLSEIIGIAKTFREQIRIRLLTHDVDVHNDYLVENGNVEKIKKLTIKGGGGTSHVPIFDYIKDKCRATELAIFLTDGYSDINNIDFKKYGFKKMFVIAKGGIDSQINQREARVINLK